MRLQEEVGPPVAVEAALIEHDGVYMHLRGILIGLGPDIPNVRRANIQLADMKRLGGTVFAIGNVRLADRQFVNLYRVDRKDGLLPPSFVDGNVIPGFFR